MKKRERLKIKYNLGGGDITFKRLTRKEAEEEDLDRLRGKTLAQISPPLSLPLVYPRQRMVEGRTGGVIRAPRKRGRELAARSRPILAPEEEKKNENELPGDVTTIRRGDETERLGFHRRAKGPSLNRGSLGRFQLSAPLSVQS